MGDRSIVSTKNLYQLGVISLRYNLLNGRMILHRDWGFSYKYSETTIKRLILYVSDYF